MRGPALYTLLLALLLGCSQTNPEPEPDPDPGEPRIQEIARLGDPVLKGPGAERLELTKLAGVSRPALCLGSRGHFEISTPPHARRIQFSVGVKRAYEKKRKPVNFYFNLMRPRNRQRPEILHSELVRPIQVGWSAHSVALPASETGLRLRFEVFGGESGVAVALDPEGTPSGCWASGVVEG